MASLRKRSNKYYAQYYVGGQQRRISLNTSSYQIAREKLRYLELDLANGNASPLPTQTPIADIVTRYVEHIRVAKSPKSAQTDIYYLRSIFGLICPALEITSRKLSGKRYKRPVKSGYDKRLKPKTIEANCFEQITTLDIADFIATHVRQRGLAPKTANRYREILCRLFNWSMKQGIIKTLEGLNPAATVERYREKASQISFLTIQQIEEQLEALSYEPSLQAMVAMYIFAGLRREEALWLQGKDINFSSGDNGMIIVRAKEVAGEYWQPKTAKNRAVPISTKLRGYLNAYSPCDSKDGWFFPSPKGQRYDPDNFSRDLRKAQRKANLNWSCLDFRHTFGSQLAMKGESLYKISTLMGNSPDICRRHYAALIPEELSSCVEF